MTRPPRSRFETIIQGFLDNVQRGNQNIERRFEAQDQRDFAREQYQTQRDDYLADRLQDREWKLTDEARALRLSQRDLLLQNLWALERDDPDYDNVLALITQLGTPSQLTGEAAMREATNGLFASADGSSMPIDMLIGRLKRKADNTQRGDDWAAQHVAQVSEYVRDFNRDPAARANAINGVMTLRNRGVTDDMIDALLASAGVVDPQGRQAIINAGVIDEQTIRLNEANIRRAETLAEREEYEFRELQDTREYRDEANQLQLQGLKQQLGFGDLDAFMRIGAIPTDEAARRQLARMLGVDEEALAERGHSIYNQWTRSLKVANDLADSQIALNNVSIDGAKLQNAINQHAFDRTKAMENLHDRQAMAQSLAEAVALGQVEFVREMQALQDVYPEVLGGMDFGSLIAQAEFVRGDENDIRNSAAAQRKYAVTTAALAAAQDLDDYIDRHANAFLPLALPSEYDPVSGSYPQLERAIDELVRNMPSAYLEEFGGEQLVRERLRASVERQRVVKGYSDDASSLDMLIANPPSPENPAARAAWQNQVAILAERLGLDPQVWDVIGQNVLDGHELDFYAQVAKNRLDNQQADYLYQSTVGQYIDNLTGWWDYERLLAGGGEGFDLGTMKDLVAMLNTTIEGAKAITESPACNLAGTDEARWGGQGGLSFNPDNQGGECGAAMQRQVAAEKALNTLVMGFVSGADGAQTFDPLATRGTSPQGEAGPGVPPPPASLIVEHLEATGVDPSTFDAAVYESLSAEDRRLASYHIRNGVPPEEVLDTILGAVATESGLLSAPAGLPTLQEAGVSPNSLAWMQLPVEERINQLRGTKEWQEQAAKFAEVGMTTGYSVAEILNPQDDLAADALEAVFGGPITPDAALQQLAQRYGLLSTSVEQARAPGPMRAPGSLPDQRFYVPPPQPEVRAPRYHRNTGELLEEGVNVEFRPGRGWVPVADPYHLDRGDFDVASFAAAMQQDAELAIQRGVDEVRERLREMHTEDLRARDYVEWVQPPATGGAQAGAGVSGPGVGAPPGQADHRGSGGTGDYSGLPGQRRQQAPAPQAPDSDPMPVEGLAVSPQGVAQLRGHEGLRLEAYQDAAGVWTIGFGHTGSAAKPGARISEERAHELLAQDMETAARAVRRSITVPLRQGQFDALVSWVYNLGAGAWDESGIAELINAGKFQEAAERMRRYNKAKAGENGELVELPGLTARREREAQALLAGVR